MAKAKKFAKKAAKKKASSKRELIQPKGDKRYTRRDSKGRIGESDDQGKSLSRNIRTKAKTKSEPDQGDKGDQ